MRCFINFRKKTFFCCFLFFLLVGSMTAYGQTKSQFLSQRVPAGHDFTKVQPDAAYRPKHLIVRFAPDSKGSQRLAMEHQSTLEVLGGGTLKQGLMASQGIYLVELPEGVTVEEALKTYNAREGIYYAEPDYKLELLTTPPNDTRFSELWGLHNIGQTGGAIDADIDALEAWELNTNAENIIVAVIDTGIDYNHEDLAANMWINDDEFPGDYNNDGYPGVQGIDDDDDGLIDEDTEGRQPGDPGYTNDLANDDDENGYVDDLRGWDFFAEDNDPMDYMGHGTHCAGTIGAIGNNNLGVTGVCWNVKLMACQISHYDKETWFVWASNATEAIYYAVQNGARVLSNSWGGFSNIQSLKDSIEHCLNSGVLFVAAAGNESSSTPRYPALYDYDNIISVLATDHNDEMAFFSSYNSSTVDLGAPGVSILSCIPNNYYAFSDGTSMATPHVAGACALVWSVNTGLSHLEVKDTILDSVDKLDSLTGLCLTEGRLNLHQAMLLNMLSIVDDVNDLDCRGLGEEITYTIEWINNYDYAITDANVIVYLPSGLDFDSAAPEGNYESSSHTYTWQIGTIESKEFGQVTITGIVNETAAPGFYVDCIAELLDGDHLAIPKASEETLVCCWDASEIIYVDQNSTGGNTGVSWADAYTDLADAIRRARDAICEQTYRIYVAQGIYTPEFTPTHSYKIPEGVKVYGGFPTGGCASHQRNPQRYRTILTGRIDGDTRADTVVTMGDQTLLDGCTVTGASFDGYGIYGSGVDFVIEKCVIADNENYGIFAKNGNVTIQWCEINKNKRYGIRHEGEGYSLTVENTQIRKNNEYGIYCLQSTPIIKNSISSENDLSGFGYAGFVSINPTYSPILHNNTFAYNRAEGILFTDDGDASGDPNYPDWPDVQNCILWYNNDGGKQYAGFTKSNIFYSCVYDPNNPAGTLTLDSHNNFSAEPMFAYLNEPNNVHIAWDSPCKDMGNPGLVYLHQVDMDDQSRVAGNAVDIGADEINCENVFHPLDWDADGVINYEEFNAISRSWQSGDPNDPSIITDPNFVGHPDYVDPNTLAQWKQAWFAHGKNWDLDGNLRIDLDDVALFCEDDPQVWLWVACWKNPFDCGDGFNTLDRDKDGLVNMKELSLFSTYWDSYLPSDPLWQFCNLDNTGTSEYTIDLADLALFTDDWLWVACWRTDLPEPPVEPVMGQDPNEQPSVFEQALELNENICLSWDLWENDPNMQQQIDPNEWIGFMDALCSELDDLVNSMSAFEQALFYTLAGEDCCGGQQAMSGGGPSTSSGQAGGESMMGAQGEALFVFSEAKELSIQDKVSIAEPVIQLGKSIEMLEQLWLEDPEFQTNIHPDDWQKFMDVLYEELHYLYLYEQVPGY